jgi:hypothetical protein
MYQCGTRWYLRSIAGKRPNCEHRSAGASFQHGLAWARKFRGLPSSLTLEVVVKGMTKVRVSLLGLGFGVALLFAPSAFAQAESNPDHFTETGVEVGPGGNTALSSPHAAVQKPAQMSANSVVVPAAVAERSPKATVHVAVAVADKNRPAVAAAPKR